MTPTRAMVFAAGFGTRMRPLTDTRPKPLIEVAGQPLLDHALELVSDAGADPVINAHYHADQIVTHCKDRPDCTVVVEHPEVLDTGGGLKHAIGALGPDPVFTLNCDAVWAGPNPLTLLASRWNPDAMDALLMLVPLERTVAYSRSGNFALSETSQITKSDEGMVYTGAQIIRTEVARNHPEDVFSMHVLWDHALARGRAFGITYPGNWADVGTPEGIALAEEMLQAHHV